LRRPLLTIHYSLPQNKKPGVERRVQPPTLRWLHAMLDIFLACARKEPHYRIYFLAFAWYYAGKTLLRPDCDAPAGSATPEPFVSILIFLYPSSPRNHYFLYPLCFSVQKPGSPEPALGPCTAAVDCNCFAAVGGKVPQVRRLNPGLGVASVTTYLKVHLIRKGPHDYPEWTRLVPPGAAVEIALFR
jgi:hypothetical protein